MGRTADYSKEHCSVAAALSVVGDPWTLLILRDAFRGVRRFDDWQTGLGVARNVLAARLKRLVAYGVLEAQPYSHHPPRKDYVLTKRGRDLLPVLLALKTWGDRHVYCAEPPPVDFVHTCGANLQPRFACQACGELLKMQDISLVQRKSVSVGELMVAMGAAEDDA